MPKGLEKVEMKILPHEKKEANQCQRSANHGQIGQHWLACNSYFPCGRIFISSFSELLGINIEDLNSLLLGIQLFINIYFDGLWLINSIIWIANWNEIETEKFIKGQSLYLSKEIKNNSILKKCILKTSITS